MRLSEVISLPPAASGTLKSTRMKTRRPAMSSSEIVLIDMVCLLAPYPAPGRLRAKKSAPGQGATFTVELPLPVADASKASSS